MGLKFIQGIGFIWFHIILRLHCVLKTTCSKPLMAPFPHWQSPCHTAEATWRRWLSEVKEGDAVKWDFYIYNIIIIV